MQTEGQMPKENGMSVEEAIRNIEIAKAEVGWNYPKEYAIAFEIAFEIAIKALEKQIPKEAYDVDEDMRTFTCPSCLSDLYSEDIFSDYCCVCGQKLDWSEE